MGRVRTILNRLSFGGGLFSKLKKLFKKGNKAKGGVQDITIGTPYNVHHAVQVLESDVATTLEMLSAMSELNALTNPETIPAWHATWAEYMNHETFRNANVQMTG